MTSRQFTDYIPDSPVLYCPRDLTVWVWIDRAETFYSAWANMIKNHTRRSSQKLTRMSETFQYQLNTILGGDASSPPPVALESSNGTVIGWNYLIFRVRPSPRKRWNWVRTLRANTPDDHKRVKCHNMWPREDGSDLHPDSVRYIRAEIETHTIKSITFNLSSGAIY
jgi:hypothetical protein